MSNQVKNKDKNQSDSNVGWHSFAIIMDNHARIKFITKQLSALLGYSVSELLGQDAIEILVDKDKQEQRRSELDFLYKQESVIDAFDAQLKSRDSGFISIRFSILKLSSLTGNSENIAFIGDNLSESRKVVESILDPESQLAEIVDSAKEIVVIINGDEKIQRINETGENKLGIKAGMSLRDLLEYQAIKKTSSFLISLSKISSIANINLVFLHPDTKQRFFLAGTVSSIVVKAKLKEFRLILHDVTEQIQTQKAKDFYYAIAHHSIHSKNLDELYYNIHKELKKVVDCENMYIALQNKESEENIISFPYYQESDFQSIGRTQRKFGQGLTEYIISTENPQIITKKELLDLSKRGEITLHGKIPEIWIGVPLKVHAKVIGVIAIQSFHSQSFYSSRDLKMLNFASSQIAMAIDMMRTQEKLKTQTAKLNSIIESSSHLIWTVNSDFKLTSFNKNYFDAIEDNLKIMPIIKEGNSDLAKSIISFWEKKYQKAFAGNQIHFEIKLKNINGDEVWKEIYLNPIYLDGDLINDVSGIAHDITEKKKSEQALIEAKDLAEALLVVKEQFLANMSHEIRTPLNGIIGVIDLLEQTKLAKDQGSYLKTIKASSETLLNILNDILDLSKIEAGKMQLRASPMALVRLIKQLKSLFTPRAATHLIKLKFHLSKNIPKVIEADETRLIQVISNLLANSIKFTPRGGSIDIGLEIKAEINNDLLIRVDVRDSGIGIKKEDMDKLFTNFTQLDTSTTKSYGGTGLGLSISKQLVDIMGGEIGVFSNPGLGSTFWFSFLAKKSNKKVIEEEEPRKFKDGITKFTEFTPSILVVDDNLVNRDVAGEILKKSGCHVDLASNGIEAVFKAKTNDYDIIFMDIQMPEMDGIEANRQIKNLDKNKQPIVVAMTAYSMKEDEKRFLAAGLDDYLSKPIRANHLIGMVEQKIQGKIRSNIKLESRINPLQVVNKDTINQLRKYGGAEMVFNALKEFEEEVESQILECNIALINEDFDTIKRHLHTLKGSAGTLGIEKIAQISQDIEAEVKEQDYSNVKRGLLELSNNFAEFKENFTNIISNY